MSFSFVEYPNMIISALNFGNIQTQREIECSAEYHQVFTTRLKDTKLKYVPDYLIGDGIIYDVDESLPNSLVIE